MYSPEREPGHYCLLPQVAWLFDVSPGSLHVPFAQTVRQAGGIGKLHHSRDILSIDRQAVVRANREEHQSREFTNFDRRWQPAKRGILWS